MVSVTTHHVASPTSKVPKITCSIWDSTTMTEASTNHQALTERVNQLLRDLPPLLQLPNTDPLWGVWVARKNALVKELEQQKGTRYAGLN